MVIACFSGFYLILLKNVQMFSNNYLMATKSMTIPTMTFSLAYNVLSFFVRLHKPWSPLRNEVKTRKTSIADISSTNMPSNRGKKSTKSTSIRKGSANKKQETVAEYIEPSQDVASSHSLYLNDNMHFVCDKFAF
jgi:hypothetical protein